uniref:Dahlein-1.1 n=1 Tax=Ranoidea dahlii TaxID=299727 RepID=DAH11_RANDH|nr:RecName: Full=Dahlein-1.1 [Ranoidea dahlii]
GLFDIIKNIVSTL